MDLAERWFASDGNGRACTRLEYVSSSGLRIFLTLLKKARMKGHMVTISNANKYLIQVFDDAGFTRLFTMK